MSVDFWYLLISLRATVPGLNLGFFLSYYEAVILAPDLLMAFLDEDMALALDGIFFPAFLAFGILVTLLKLIISINSNHINKGRNSLTLFQPI